MLPSTKNTHKGRLPLVAVWRLVPQHGKHELRRQVTKLVAEWFSRKALREASGVSCHGFFQCVGQRLAAETFSDEAQQMGNPISVQVVHSLEFVLHALGEFLGLDLNSLIDTG